MVPQIVTKIVGISRHQRAAARCRDGETLILQREPDNAYDEQSIAVLRLDGTPLGYLKANLAAELAPRMDDGETFTAWIKDLTGGEPDRPTRGINIWIAEAETDPNTGVARKRKKSFLRQIAGAITRLVVVLVVIAVGAFYDLKSLMWLAGAFAY